ncbi:unnamed protein product [Notodromas monacha]|uniref:Sulfhydryl oxidase n=1 Tax=Notodromas monacha TaxID=399045 RepID=A0A7R9BU45_9CRUS|nr:unnamed protein product [Notodromas monacha]CAG0920394.1 unnamed protein product [Notodromas monacha]
MIPVLLLIFVTSSSMSSVMTSGNRGQVHVSDALYLKSDPIQILTADTFNKNVLRSKTAWIVEFYSTWCGHCRNYAATWKQLAVQVYGWRKVIRLGAIDCADERNTPICRTYQVIGYPTILLFPPGLTSKKYLGVEMIGAARHSVRELRRKMADYVEEVKLKYDIEHFPSLEFFQNETLPAQKDGNETRVLIFEVDGDELGRGVILDTSLFSGIRAWRVRMTSPLAAAFGVKSAPVVIILDSNNHAAKVMDGLSLSTSALVDALRGQIGGDDLKETAPTYNVDPTAATLGVGGGAEIGSRSGVRGNDDDHDVMDGLSLSTSALVDALRGQIGGDALKETAPTYNVDPTAATLGVGGGAEVGSRSGVRGNDDDHDDFDNEEFVVYERVIYQADLTNALKYSLQHEVALHPNLTGESLTALRGFLRVMSTHFPEPRVRDSLAALGSWVVPPRESVSADEWTGFFDALDTTRRGLPPAVEYVGCRGSSRQYRGYPCGLWTLYHVLTVDAFRMEQEDLARGSSSASSPAAGEIQPQILEKHANGSNDEVYIGELANHSHGSRKRPLGLDVLRSLVAFIRNFFSCKYCSRHFQEMATESLHQVTDSRGAVMWLWSAHNKVNKRLAGDVSEDPRYPKVQFPPEDLCWGCMNQAKGTWDEDKVFNFLRKYYGAENIVNSNRKLTSVIVLGNDDRFELTSGSSKTRPNILAKVTVFGLIFLVNYLKYAVS